MERKVEPTRMEFRIFYAAALGTSSSLSSSTLLMLEECRKVSSRWWKLHFEQLVELQRSKLESSLSLQVSRNWTEGERPSMMTFRSRRSSCKFNLQLSKEWQQTLYRNFSLECRWMTVHSHGSVNLKSHQMKNASCFPLNRAALIKNAARLTNYFFRIAWTARRNDKRISNESWTQTVDVCVVGINRKLMHTQKKLINNWFPIQTEYCIFGVEFYDFWCLQLPSHLVPAHSLTFTIVYFLFSPYVSARMLNIWERNRHFFIKTFL